MISFLLFCITASAFLLQVQQKRRVTIIEQIWLLASPDLFIIFVKSPNACSGVVWKYLQHQLNWSAIQKFNDGLEWDGSSLCFYAGLGPGWNAIIICKVMIQCSSQTTLLSYYVIIELGQQTIWDRAQRGGEMVGRLVGVMVRCWDVGDWGV